jgi:hypothetical protein
MSNFTAIANGNWNASTTWFLVDPGGGEGSQYPGSGDNVDLNGFVVTWPTSMARIPSTGTLGNITSGGTTAGQLDLTWTGVASNFSLYAGAITAGYKPTVEGLIYVHGNPSGTRLFTLDCTTITGGGNTGSYGAYISTTGNITINTSGGAFGSAALRSHGVYIANSSGSAVITINSNLTGGTYSSAGVGLVYVRSSITVNGNITAGTGSLGGQGLQLNEVGNWTLGAYNIIDALVVGVYISPTTWNAGYGNYRQTTSIKLPKILPADVVKSGQVHGDITGTYAAGGVLIHGGMNGGLNG